MPQTPDQPKHAVRGGATPKREAARAGHRKKEDRADVVNVAGPAVPPLPANPDWGEDARGWYDALAQSAQSRFYEASDWQLAKVTANMVDSLMKAERPSAEMFKAILAAGGVLGVTEGDRRRMRMEVVRGQEAAAAEGEAREAVTERFRVLAGGGE